MLFIVMIHLGKACNGTAIVGKSVVHHKVPKATRLGSKIKQPSTARHCAGKMVAGLYKGK